MTLRDTPIGVDAIRQRYRTGSTGVIDVPADRCWGAVKPTQPCDFCIGDDRMPMNLYPAYNCHLPRLDRLQR